MKRTDDDPWIALAEARRTLERERTLFQGGPVVVFRWIATDGWPVETVSANVRELFGWSAEDFVSGRVAYASVIHPDDLARVAGEVAAHSASGDTRFEQDYRIVRRDGEVRWLYDLTTIQRGPDGAVTHYLGYVLDVTARREAEAAVRAKDEQLLQGQKMEALGRLAGGVAHDVNNLLTAIAGHVALVRRALPPGSAAHGSLDVIAGSVGQGASLTGQLLAFSRRQVLDPKVVDVAAVTDQTLRLVGPLLGPDVALESSLGALATARVDPTQLQQVVMNLVLNARDAMPRGGRIAVTVARRVLSTPIPTRVDDAIAAGEWAVLAVRDTGVGMDAGTAARAFEPFFTTRAAGTGLGLASVYGIARQSGGHVRVETAPGHGSLFEVWLPLEPTPEPAPPREAAPPPAARGGAAVLLVEDHPDIREVTAEVLRLAGHTVDAAADGAEALRRVAEGAAVDLLVTDLSLPGTGGEALVERLSAAGFRGPVLFVSGHAGDPVRHTGPGRAFLRKPYTMDALVRACAELLAGGPDGAAEAPRV